MSDISNILSTIQDAVDKLSASVSARQPALFKQVLVMLKKLETRGDTLLSNINNLKLINNIKVTLEKLMIDDKYKEQVKAFVDSYNAIQDLNNAYFAKFASNEAGIKKGKLGANQQALNILSKTAIDSTINNLTETGLQAGVTEPLRKILLTNVNSGGSYADLTDQLRNYMLTDDKSEGALERYVKTYSNTAINQFSAEYNKSIADDLGLEWYMYDGSLLTTSREFCELAVQKKYIHVSEFDILLSGDFGELGTCHISNSTGLPDGLMAGTDKSNFLRRRGGWNCGHQAIAVDDSVVPEDVKNQVYATAAYKAWATKNGKAQKEEVKTESKPNSPTPADIEKAKEVTGFTTWQNNVKDKAVLKTYNITKEEAATVNGYSDTAYFTVNQVLRKEQKATTEYDAFIKILKSAVDKLPTNFRGTAYRGTDLKKEDFAKYTDALKKGEPVIHDYFTSATESPFKKFSGNTVFYISSKNGKQIQNLSEHPQEIEVLFNAGTAFKVISAKTEDGVNYIELEEAD